MSLTNKTKTKSTTHANDTKDDSMVRHSGIVSDNENDVAERTSTMLENSTSVKGKGKRVSSSNNHFENSALH